MNLSLRQLRAFVAVVRAGSFNHAASSLHLTQAAVSHLVRDLEDVVGARLLERTTRTVRLSKAGDIFLPHAERVLASLQGAELCASDLRQGRAGDVLIAATHLLSSVKLPAPMAAFQAAQPETRVRLLDRSADALVGLVADGTVDMALGPERPVSPDVVAETVFVDDLMLVCSPRHRLAGRERVAWRDLQGETFIVSGAGGALRTMLEIDFVVRMEPVIEVEHFSTAMALVGADRGITVATAYVRPYLELHSLWMAALLEPAVRRRIMLYRHAERTWMPAAQNFAAFLRDLLQAPAS
jgi:DNA-binding transcriptional LysR family regulator